MANIIKRVIDPDTAREVSLSKKPRYALETATKEKVLKFFGLAYNAAYMSMIQEVVPTENISIAIQVMNTVVTAHTILRQMSSNSNAAIIAKVNKNPQSWTHMGQNHQIPMGEVIDIVQYCALVNGLNYFDNTTHTWSTVQLQTEMQVDEESFIPPGPYTNLIKGKDWFGIAGPFSNFLSGFGLRLKELRLGHSEFPVSKDSTSTTSYPISKFGLNRAHHVLLEGIRFPPEKRSSMVQSLGPMTSVLCYLQTPPQYESKFLNAAVSSLFHIPNIESILKTVKTMPRAGSQSILGLIGDITLISTSRQRHRATPPPNIFAAYVTDRDQYNELRALYTADNRPNVADPGLATENLCNVLTMSGFPAAFMYNKAATRHYQLNGSFTPAEAAQVIFHCWWGTYKEDFGVLKSITQCPDWVKRDQLGNKFQKMNNCGTTTSNITLIKLTKFAKLASANQVGAMAQGQKQVASMPVFGGSRKRKFEQGFFKYLDEQTPAGSGVLTATGIEADLTAHLRMLKTRLQNENGIQNAGTTRWIDMERSNRIECVRNPTEIVYLPDDTSVQETCEYFLN